MPGRRHVIAVLALASLVAPALPAAAYDDTAEFEIVFPQDPLATSFVSSFGAVRSGGRSHHGTDLMSPKMTPVYAAAAGIVTVMRSGGSAGEWLEISHAGGWETWYMHLNEDTPGTNDGAASPEFTYAPLLRVGSVVTAGQLIGWVGDSGNASSSNPHTHFEIHHDGRVLNPYPFLIAAHERALASMPVELYLLAVSPDLLSVVE